MHYDHLLVTKFHVRPCGPTLWPNESLPMSSTPIELIVNFFCGVGIFKACKKLRGSPSLQNTHNLDEFLRVYDLIYMWESRLSLNRFISTLVTLGRNMYLFNHIAENKNAEVQQKFNRLRFEALLFLLGCPITQ